MDVRVLRELNRERAARRAVVHLTDLGTDQDWLIREGEAIEGPLGETVLSALRSGKSGVVEAEGRQFFLNVHVPPARILVVGAVHISRALAQMAGVAGFELTIVDPRTDFAAKDRFAGIDLVAGWPEDTLKTRPLDAYTALVAVTHDPAIDDLPLSRALAAGCFYVGALGSRKTHARRAERLKALGHGEMEIARISAPVGLDIGAANPAEIAVAILADIVAHLRRRPLRGAHIDVDALKEET